MSLTLMEDRESLDTSSVSSLSLVLALVVFSFLIRSLQVRFEALAFETGVELSNELTSLILQQG